MHLIFEGEVGLPIFPKSSDVLGRLIMGFQKYLFGLDRIPYHTYVIKLG